VGLFCAYLRAFLAAHPQVDQSATLAVRLLDPTGMGLPIQITCFSRKKDLVPYEAVQASIFEHFYATLPAFGLRAYQAPAAEMPVNSNSSEQ
jgi:miniconductance mechanosensitive channel